MPTSSAPRPDPAPGVAHFPSDRIGDGQLVEAAARGDRSALGVVWDRYSGFVRGVLRGAMGPDAALDDLVQDVFLAFMRGAKEIEDGARLRSYLAGVAVRTAAMEIRRRKVRRWVGLSATGDLPETPSSPRDVEGREALRALHRVLETLGHRQRMAFVLRHVEGLEVLDVAAALGISESTLRRELLRARSRLLVGAQREPALLERLTRMTEGAR